MPWNGLYRVPLGLLNFNFAFMKITCALDVPCRRPEWLSGGEVEKDDVPCRRPEWLSGGEVEKEWLHLREAYASEWPQGQFPGAGEFHDPPRRHLA